MCLYERFPVVLIRPASEKRILASDLDARNIRASGKHSIWPKVGRPLNVHVRLAEWAI